MSNFKRTVLSLIGPRLLLSARICGVHEPSEKFRFVEIEAEAFMTLKPSPGDKVQINTGNWDLRTYTPISYDAQNGRLGILAYIHGQGPGSRWAQKVKPGDLCQLLGPRQSLRQPQRPFVFFGDETALGTAASLQRLSPHGPLAKFIFETSDPDEVARIVCDLDLKKVEIVQRGRGDRDGDKGMNVAVPDAALHSILRASTEAEQVILAGRAQSIGQVRDHLRGQNFPMSRVTSKVYWSEGRIGLD